MGSVMMDHLITKPSCRPFRKKPVSGVPSGWSDVRDPNKRAKSIGMTPSFTIFLGVAEIAGGLGVAFGVLTQLAAIGLILIMLGAIQRKISIWQTGFSGETPSR